MRLAHAPPDCRADWIEARRIALEFRRSVRADPRSKAVERRAGYSLAVEWAALIAGTYAIAYAVEPWPLKLALLVPWSIYASLALDNLTHYANHWPLFASRFAQRVWRASGVLVFYNPLEIRHVHGHHHRSYASQQGAEPVFGPSEQDRSVWSLAGREALQGVFTLVPWRRPAPELADLRASSPAQWREIVGLRWAALAWALALLSLDFWNTLCFFLPATIVVASLASYVMNLTDHVPGDAAHPFRLATYHETRAPIERALSIVNHHTAATHLTHHLFPDIHWVHLPALQRELAGVYARHGAPRSLIVNTLLVGNPWRLISVLRRVEADRCRSA